MYRKMFLAALIAALACTMAFAASIEGKWKATFDTQMGTQNYTYEFHVDGNKVTGTATNDRGPTPITEGKLDGDTIAICRGPPVSTATASGIEYTGSGSRRLTKSSSRERSENLPPKKTSCRALKIELLHTAAEETVSSAKGKIRISGCQWSLGQRSWRLFWKK